MWAGLLVLRWEGTGISANIGGGRRFIATVHIQD